MRDTAYAVAIRKEGKDFVVSVRDLPEVVTAGDTYDEALELAADAIEVVVGGRIDDGMELPPSSAPKAGEVLVALPAWLAAKAAVYRAWKRAGISKSELARRMGRSETEVRRILDARHGTRLNQLDEAARALGGRLVVGFEEEAA